MAPPSEPPRESTTDAEPERAGIGEAEGAPESPAAQAAEAARPPPTNPSLEQAQESVDALVRRYLSLPPIAIAAIPPAPDDGVDRTASTLPPSKAPSLDDLKGYDAKLAELEPHLAETNWDNVLEILGQSQTLPPQLALLFAIAQRERDVQGDADGVAIRSTAALLGVPVDSHAALVIAKRLLRRNPVAWQERKAPPARISVLIALIVAIVGALAGYLLSPGAPLFK